MSASIQRTNDVVCFGCGCLCDDLVVTTQGNRIVSCQNACPVAEAWLMRQEDVARPICTVRGQSVSLAEGIATAAKLLRDARHPLIYGLCHTTTNAQRALVAIADWLGGTIDAGVSRLKTATTLAMQQVGQVTATLGEIQQRADVIVVWGADPVVQQPRLLSRLLDRPGMFAPSGRAQRRLIVIDSRVTATSDAADEFIHLRNESHHEALVTLRLLLAGQRISAEQVADTTGIALDVWQGLCHDLRQAKYGAILYGEDLLQGVDSYHVVEQLLRLTRSLNDHTRFVCRGLSAQPNAAGAEQVLTWRTGYANHVNFAAGYPRSNTAEYNAQAMLERGEVDAALILDVGGLLKLSNQAQEALANIPRIVIGAHETPFSEQATVSIAICRNGIATGGTVYRLDDVPLALRPVLTSTYPSDAEVLAQLEMAVRP